MCLELFHSEQVLREHHLIDHNEWLTGSFLENANSALPPVAQDAPKSEVLTKADQFSDKYLLAKLQPSDHLGCHYQYRPLPTTVMPGQLAEGQSLEPLQVEVHSFDTGVNFQEAKPTGELCRVVGFSVVAC